MRNFKHNSTLPGDSIIAGLPVLGCAKSEILQKSVPTILLAVSLFCSGTAFAADDSGNQPVTIDDLGFSEVMNGNLFTSRLEVSAENDLKPAAKTSTNAGVLLSSMMELESETREGGDRSGINLGNSDLQDKGGFRIRRFSTSVKYADGSLTVGNNWSNFQDFLGAGKSVLNPSETVALGAVTANQVKWASENGLGVAIEQGFTSSSGEGLEDSQQSPSLVLSWEGASKSGLGQYRMSALGHQVEADEVNSGEDRDIGWGLNLAGGWRFGDLFAKLSLTLGNSIDSFILGRFSDKSASTEANTSYRLNEAFNISPSINYQLTEKGNLHLSVNRFQSSEELAVNGVDTLDTVHLGYTWTPWPSTRFGIEYVGKDVEGNTELSDSNELNFAARKQF